MGWAGANPIFDRVASAMLMEQGRKTIQGSAVTEVLAVLIDALRDEDWDTTGESINEFRDEPVVMAAFRKAMPDRFESDEGDENLTEEDIE